MTLEEIEYYGGNEISLSRVDIRGVWSLSLDLRAETGGPAGADETRWVKPGTFALSVFEPSHGDHPVGEIRIWFGGRELYIVGHLTGRPGVVEVTPDHLSSAIKDDGYRAQVLRWLGVAA